MMEDKKLRLVDLFHSLDRDGSGTIDAAELVAAFSRHGVNATVDEVSELLNELDVDGNNHIAIQEFLPQMRAVQNERRRQAKRHRRNAFTSGTPAMTASASRGRRGASDDYETAATPHSVSQGKLTMTRSERAKRAVAAQRSASQTRHVARMRELQ